MMLMDRVEENIVTKRFNKNIIATDCQKNKSKLKHNEMVLELVIFKY